MNTGYSWDRSVDPPPVEPPVDTQPPGAEYSWDQSADEPPVEPPDPPKEGE